MKCCPEIKICGITQPQQGWECAMLGADAIGLVFYPRSPRNVDIEQAKEIVDAAKGKAKAVGVFVDASIETITQIRDYCGIDIVQLHGNESNEFTATLAADGFDVIKVLKQADRLADDIIDNPDVKILIECGKGILPGGNGAAWNWAVAKDLINEKGIIISGGINPQNVIQAISLSNPDAVDVSSGVEETPGLKDMQKVKDIISKVKNTIVERRCRRVF